MIYGIGTDMVDIKRIERLYQQYRDAFALKILSRIEYLEWQSHPQPVAFLAKRFGEPIRNFVERYLTWVMLGFLAIIIFGFWLVLG